MTTAGGVMAEPSRPTQLVAGRGAVGCAGGRTESGG